jgi:hypothetical protein
MFPALSAMIVATPLIVVMADQVPRFDLEPTCRGAVPAAGGGGHGSDVCIRSELSARDQLVKDWASFPPADRRGCVELTNMTHMPSYAQVITCLEMRRDARVLENPQQRSTVGQGR